MQYDAPARAITATAGHGRSFNTAWYEISSSTIVLLAWNWERNPPQQWRWRIPSHCGVGALSVFQDRALLALDDHSLSIVDLEHNRKVCTLPAHNAKVTGAAFLRSGEMVVSVSHDRTARLWDLAGEKNVATFTGESAFECCGLSEDGSKLAVGEFPGRIHLLADLRTTGVWRSLERRIQIPRRCSLFPSFPSDLPTEGNEENKKEGNWVCAS
jgi:WD40 repeat protein